MKLNKHYLIFGGFIAVFIISRIMGLGQIYHQDEYRWGQIANPFFGYLSGPHPPLTEFLFKIVGRYVGFDYLRLVPFVFSFFNLILLYLVSLKISKNKNIALIAAGLFTVNIYSLIANLQIDIDGATLPFFILLSYYAYLHIREGGLIKKQWLVLFGIAVVGGFLTKLSFLLFVAAILFDQGYGFYYSKNYNIKQIFRRFWPWVAGFFVLGVSFYYFYLSNFGRIIQYAEHFKSLDFGSRAYIELFFKVFKSLVWLSPLLALPVIYGLFRKDILKKYQLWFAYLFFNLLFYLVLFDFTTLTIERYFMFLIVPCVLISAEVVFNLWQRQSFQKNMYIIAVVAFLLMSYIVLRIPHSILPLDPKTAYLHQVKTLDFTFLIPFTGGSGPSGFYFSALYIILSWLIIGASILGVIFSKNKKNLFPALFIVFGVGYNLLFSSEYLFGTLNGSVDAVGKETIQYVNSNPAIKEVITYYDIGAYYLRLNGKYSARFYTSPKRDYVPRIQDYRGQYMIVDFPAIDKSGRYWPLIARCPILQKFQDKRIESYIFDCSRL